MLSDPKVALHEVQASSRAWASPPATPYDKDTPVSSASWISGERALRSDSLLDDGGRLVRHTNLVDFSGN
jgi:hypothetical protein